MDPLPGSPADSKAASARSHRDLHLDGRLASQPFPAAHEGRPPAEPPHRARVVAVRCHLTPPGRPRIYVRLAGHSLRRAGDPISCREYLSGPQQGLAGHAGTTTAFSADQLMLDQGGPQRGAPREEATGCIAPVPGLAFPPYEAAAIHPLIANSPLMSWFYDILSVRALAATLGTVEIIAPGSSRRRFAG